jgi:hypothetical protein
MQDEKMQMPTQRIDGQSRCFCGELITTKSMPDHVRKFHRGIGA